MTDLDIYQPGIVEPTRLAMTPAAAKELDDQLRACTKAVLRRGVDYGEIPGTDGKDVLLKPGAEKLLQWFGFAYTMECLDIERDDDGKKQGVTYRCGIVKRLPDGSIYAIAACEGYAGYEEPKFYKSAEQNRADAEHNERKWAKQYQRDVNPAKWEYLGEYRAPWNTVIKRAQKRAFVGATINATAAAGLFREDEEPDRPQEDDGPSWYQQALAAVGNLKDVAAADTLWRASAAAAKEGRITPRQATHIQNKIKPRREKLKAAVVVEAEDLASAAERAHAAAEDPQDGSAGDSTAQDATPRAAGAAPSRGAQPLPPLPGENEPDAPSDEVAKEEDRAAGLEPGEAAEFGTERHQKLIGIVWAHLGRLGYPGDKDEDDGQRVKRLADVATLAGVSEIGSTGDLDTGELSLAADTLSRCKNRKALDALLGAARKGGGDEQ